jgi:hypothetical protein
VKLQPHKILRVIYYWPNVFKDAHVYDRKCEPCQKCVDWERKPTLYLSPMAIEEPFDQWGLDVIGENNPHSSKQY